LALWVSVLAASTFAQFVAGHAQLIALTVSFVAS
jgi:hypothetical protein